MEKSFLKQLMNLLIRFKKRLFLSKCKSKKKKKKPAKNSFLLNKKFKKVTHTNVIA